MASIPVYSNRPTPRQTATRKATMPITLDSTLKAITDTSLVLLTNSQKFHTLTQTLPVINGGYTGSAVRTYYASSALEELEAAIRALGPAADSPVLLEDVNSLIGFMDDVIVHFENALPERDEYDDEVVMFTPRDYPTIVNIGNAAECAIRLVTAVLRIVGDQWTNNESTETEAGDVDEPKVEHSNQTKVEDSKDTKKLRRELAAMNSVDAVRALVRKLTFDQPFKGHGEIVIIETPRSKLQGNVLKLLNEFLGVEEDGDESEDLAASMADSPKDDQEQEQSTTPTEKPKPKPAVLTHTIARDPKEDDMPADVIYDPNAVYVRIHKSHVLPETLDYYSLPWSVPKNDQDYYIIWKPLEDVQCDVLFDHTKKVKILEKHSTIDSKKVVANLSERWLALQMPCSTALPEDFAEDLKSFEKDLADLVIEEKKRPAYPRPLISIDRPHARLHPRPRRRSISPVSVVRRRSGNPRTDYNQPWSQNSGSVFQSLRETGWQPVYVRGTDDGQTWYTGARVFHVRRFNKEYSPPVVQIIGTTPNINNHPGSEKEYLLIGKEWIDEEALQRQGWRYQSLGLMWALDPRLAWPDIEIAACATSAFREERLFRKYRQLPGGDLYGAAELVLPGEDWLQGPSLAGFAAEEQKDDEGAKKEATVETARVSRDYGVPADEGQDGFVKIAK